MKQFTQDALRTEPDYQAAMERLQSVRAVRLLHAAIGMATEAGELLDMLKRHIFYGKPIDATNAIEEVGDSTWYERIACDELSVEYMEMVAINVRKLRARFPGKFTESAAINRDLTEERRILENSEHVDGYTGSIG